MALKTFHKTVNSDGEYSCGDIGISAKEWLGLLKETNAQPYLDTLYCFLREPEHKSSCTLVSQKYGESFQYYNSKIVGFSKWVQKKLNRFRVQNPGGGDTFWCVTMQKGWDTKQGFIWQMRDELVEALQAYLFQDLISQYRTKKTSNDFKEEYKWKLLDKTEETDVLNIIKNLKGQNIVDNAHIDSGLKFLLETKPEELTTIGNHLFDESKPIEERLATFKEEMRALCPSDWKICANDERTASALLMCKYPEKYTTYMDTLYQLICQYFGFEYHNKAGKKYGHFMKIINKFTDEYGEEIQQCLIPQIGKYKNKPLNLAVQTLFWRMQDYMKNKLEKNMKKYWLTGYTWDEDNSQFDRFINEGIWESKYKDDIQSDQKLLLITKSVSEGDIIILKSTSTKRHTHDLPFMRIKAIGIVSSNISTYKIEGGTKCQCSVNYVNTDEKDFDGAIYGSYQKSIHLATSKISDVIEYVNSILYSKNMPQQKYKEYIELLQETHNLVLTGAPGTGKTYMAQAIAEEMGAVTKFVQFHPSYDYTDFVEGLRPVEKTDGQMGFERKDGVFKEFCHDAIKNLVDSQKSIKSLTKEISWQEKLDSFVEEAIDNGTKFKTVNGSGFVITEMRGHNIIIHNEQNEKTTQVLVNTNEILELLNQEVTLNNVRDIRDHFKHKYGSQPDSYTFVITKAIRKRKLKLPVVKANKIDLKPFVFIIDEINRGEASKIFGELFYAIDPGYRGKKDNMVQTQYQNLVPETDVFANGFYIPENVYILATMNDIDRSVESMDFAMRRRFTWKEITPDDTKSMLDSLKCSSKAKATMERLNKEITDTDGLGAAYMIGPSYFLKLKENGGDFQKLWKMNIEPLLKEYLRGFRKTSAILEKFRNAYFDKEESKTTNALD
jgi:DNA polymerase III delta prime subunit